LKGFIMTEEEPGYSKGAYESVEKEVASAEERKSNLIDQAHGEAKEINEKVYPAYIAAWQEKEELDKKITDLREQLGGTSEPKEKEERKEKTLEEQAQIYAEMFGADAEKIFDSAKALRDKMSERERKELTMLVYTPEGMTTDDAWQMVKRENPVYEYTDPAEIKTTGETEKAVVAFARYSQEPDEDMLGEEAKSAEDWEKTNGKFMSPKLRMIAGEFYRRAEGEQLDQINVTLCPGCRSQDGGVPDLSSYPNGGRVSLGSSPPGFRHPSLGVRRVVQMEV
jgi:hypothetical protein